VAVNGGGASTAAINIINSQITGNTTNFTGGGIGGSVDATDNGTGVLNVTNTTISGNSAGSNGGGVGVTVNTFPGFLSSSPSTLATAKVTMTNSTVEGNNSNNDGGGLWFTLGNAFNPQGTMAVSVTASTIDGNTATSQGGGLLARETGTATSTANVTVTNSTLFGNSAFAGAGIDNFATGPDSTAGISLLSDTVAFNQATSFAGGIVANGDHFSIRSSIVADNIAGFFPTIGDVNGTFTSGGHNLIGEIDPGFASGFDGTDLTGTPANPIDPMFGNFGNNGGPTQTLALQAGSPAIGNGDPNGPPTDQRGVFRSPTAPSIGAFEFK
jgi:hypothetical protein